MFALYHYYTTIFTIHFDMFTMTFIVLKVRSTDDSYTCLYEYLCLRDAY